MISREVALPVGVFDSQVARREVFVLRSEIDNSLAPFVGDTGPDRPWPGRAICQCINPALDPAGMPVVLCASGDA